MINMVIKKSKFKLRRKTIKILVLILNTISITINIKSDLLKFGLIIV